MRSPSSRTEKSQKEREYALELVQLLKDDPEGLIRVERMGDSRKREPDVLLASGSSAVGLEITVLLEAPANETGEFHAAQQLFSDLLWESITKEWRGVVTLHLPSAPQKPAEARILADVICRWLSPRLEQGRDFTLSASGYQVRRKVRVSFDGITAAVRLNKASNITKIVTSMGTKPIGGMLEYGEAFCASLRRKQSKAYATARTWLLVVDHSAISLFHESLEEEGLRKHAKDILGSSFERVYLLRHTKNSWLAIRII